MTRESERQHKEPWAKTKHRALTALHELRYLGNCMGGPLAGRAVVLVDEVQAALHTLTALLDSRSDDMTQKDIEVQRLKMDLRAERSKDEAPWQVADYRSGGIQDLPPRLKDLFEENKQLRAKVAHYKARTSKAEGGLRQAESVMVSLEDTNAQLSSQLAACSVGPEQVAAAAGVRSELSQAQHRVKELEQHLVVLTSKLESERRLHKNELRAFQRLAQEHSYTSNNSTSAALLRYGGSHNVSPSPQASYDASYPSPDPLSPGAISEHSADNLGPSTISPDGAAGGRGSRTAGYLGGITPHSQPLLPNMMRSHAGPASQGGRPLVSYPPSPAHLNTTLSYNPNPAHSRNSPSPHGSRSHASSPALHVLQEGAPFASRPSHMGAYASRKSPAPQGDNVRAVVGSSTLLRLLPGTSARHQHHPHHATTSVTPEPHTAGAGAAPAASGTGTAHPRSKSPGAARQWQGQPSHPHHQRSSSGDHSPLPSPGASPTPGASTSLFGQYFTPDTGLPYLLSANAAQQRQAASQGPRSPSGRAGGPHSKEGNRAHILSRSSPPEGTSAVSASAQEPGELQDSLPSLPQDSEPAGGAMSAPVVPVPPLVLPTITPQPAIKPTASLGQEEQRQEQQGQEEGEEVKGFTRLPPVQDLLSPKPEPADNAQSDIPAAATSVVDVQPCAADTVQHQAPSSAPLNEQQPQPAPEEPAPALVGDTQVGPETAAATDAPGEGGAQLGSGQPGSAQEGGGV